MLVAILLAFSAVVGTTGNLQDCSAQSCIDCGNDAILVNCTLTRLNESYYNYLCESPSSCAPKNVDPSEHGSHCVAFIQRVQQVLRFSAREWVFQGDDSCSSLRVFNFQPLLANCLDMYLEVSSIEELGLERIICRCYENNCQRTINITVYVNPPPVIVQSTSSDTTSPISSFQNSVISSPSSTNILPLPVTSFRPSTIILTSSALLFTSATTISPSLTSIRNVVEVTDTLSLNTPSATDIPSIVASTVALVAVISVLAFCLLLIISLVIVMLVCYCHKLSTKARRHSHQIHFHATPPNLETTQESTPLPFQLLQPIGQGKFGSVWKALYNEETVAVKIFSPHHKPSWQNERDINVLDSTPHDNILHFIHSNSRGIGYNAQYFIITQYLPMGSLNQFLHHNSLSWEQAWNIMYSVTSGLAHLHSTNYCNSNGFISEKYSIAHRDIKSSNVLVKNESGQCALADLGLAFILDPAADDRKLAISGQVGTYRYMAPEALDARVNLRDIESFKQIDVYALALVLWEVCMRCKIDDAPVQPYQSPFFDLVGEKPTLEQMKEAVVSSKQRPPISGKWYSNKDMRVIANFLTESWDEDPEARLTSANIIIQLENLIGMRAKIHTLSLSPLVGCFQEFVSPVSETSQSSLCKKVHTSASFSGSSSIRPFVPPVRFSVDHVDSPTNLIQSLQDLQASQRDTLPRIDSSSQPVCNEISDSVLQIDATTGQPQTQCTLSNNDTTHNDNI